MLLRFWTNSFFRFLARNLGPVVIICNLRILGKFWAKTFFQDSDKVSNFFGLAAKNKRPSFDKFSLGWHNCHRRFQMHFLRKIISFSTDFSKFSSFLELEHFFLFLGKKFSQVCQKCILRAHMKKFERINFWKKVIFISFSDFEQKRSDLYQKIWPELGKAFYVSRLTLTEQYFWRNLLKSSRFFGYKRSFRNSGEKHFLQGCQNCNKCPEEQVREKQFEIDQKNAIVLRFWTNTFFNFGEKFWPICWKCTLRIYVSLGKFEEKLFFGVWTMFQISSDFESKKIPLFEKFSLGLSQPPSARPINHLRKIISSSIEILLLTSFWNLSNFFVF